MTRTTTPAVLFAATFAFATQTHAQAPSEAQREAIKSNCRSDYIAHCSSIPPGGAASLECLQKNMSSLSASCAGAVRAVEAPSAAPKTAEEPKAEPKTEPKQEAAPAAKEAEKPAAEPKAAGAARKPSQAQISAIKSACRSDYMKVCAGVPTGGAPALECLEKNKAKVSPACAKAVAAAGGGGAPAGGGAPSAAGAGSTGGPPAAAAAPAAPAVIVLRPMRPREILFVLRSACGGDVRTLCAGVPAGGGRIIECLASQAPALSPACKDVLGQFAQ